MNKKKKCGNILEIKNEKIVIDMEGGGGWRMGRLRIRKGDFKSIYIYICME